MMRRQEVVAHYLDRTGYRCPDWTFYEVYGLFRLAGIVQQIYYRYHHGHTRDPRFAELHQLVGLLGRVAAVAVEQDRI
jgi:aminoglycoside phosphotransferase (APT) family kinase protein